MDIIFGIVVVFHGQVFEQQRRWRQRLRLVLCLEIHIVPDSFLNILQGAVHLIDARRPSHTASHTHEKDFAPQFVGHSALIYTHRSHPQQLRIVNTVDAYAFRAPADKVAGIFQQTLKLLSEKCLVGCEPFVFHTGIEQIFPVELRRVNFCGFIVFQHLQRDVAQILGREDFQQTAGHQRILCFVEKPLDYLVVTSPCLLGHCQFILVSDAVLAGQSPVVLCSLFGGDQRQFGADGRRYDVKFDISRNWLTVQNDSHLLLFSETHLLDSRHPILCHPQQHIALSGGQASVAGRIGGFLSHRIEFSIVVELELHQSPCYGIALGIHHGYIHL